ncbi:hypothetical protein RND81_12G202000 [Saponaria officinalis]|uniref:Uncharacterized protein n=1 Tax=Saponaria officinalis TaxID=3572 RepID=A0AAW1HD87_SAPOF
MTFFSKRSSNMYDKSEFGKGYFLACNSLSVSLSRFEFLGFGDIFTGIEVVLTTIASLDVDLEPSSAVLYSLSTTVLEEDERFLLRLLIVISMSWARVANSWKLLGLIPFKMYMRSQFIPLMHISTAEVSRSLSLHSKLNARHRLMYSTTGSCSHWVVFVNSLMLTIRRVL